jgi:EAL domain-containing protein (putative c-di-GMP-specific phosphodiesterase class I)
MPRDADHDPAAPDVALAALRAGRLRLALQPVRRALQPDFCVFREALARVEGPDGDILPAGSFAAELERRGHAPALDRAALALALALLRRDDAARISVNVSALTLGDPAWMRLLEQAAARRPDLPRRLIVELTETAVDPFGAACGFRERIRRLGPAFALDDYGAGYADADRAHRLRPDILKLDSSLCADASDAGAARLENALALSAQIEAMTVAEGVTDAGQAARLSRAGVFALQGWWAGAPALAAA